MCNMKLYFLQKKLSNSIVPRLALLFFISIINFKKQNNQRNKKNNVEIKSPKILFWLFVLVC